MLLLVLPATCSRLLDAPPRRPRPTPPPRRTSLATRPTQRCSRTQTPRARCPRHPRGHDAISHTPRTRPTWRTGPAAQRCTYHHYHHTLPRPLPPPSPPATAVRQPITSSPSSSEYTTACIPRAPPTPPRLLEAALTLPSASSRLLLRFPRPASLSLPLLPPLLPPLLLLLLLLLLL